jgi:hypothetical protein
LITPALLALIIAASRHLCSKNFGTVFNTVIIEYLLIPFNNENKSKIMFQKKMPTGGLVLAGLAAFAYYKYSKMSAEEKSNLMSDLKEKGQKLYEQYVPEDVRSMLSGKSNMNTNSQFGEGSAYTS